MYADPACIHHWPLVGSMIIQTRAGDLSTTRHNTPKQAHQPQHLGKGIAIDHGCNRQMIMICVDASIDTHLRGLILTERRNALAISKSPQPT
jgi:hypothetical protein